MLLQWTRRLRVCRRLNASGGAPLSSGVSKYTNEHHVTVSRGCAKLWLASVARGASACEHRTCHLCYPPLRAQPRTDLGYHFLAGLHLASSPSRSSRCLVGDSAFSARAVAMFTGVLTNAVEWTPGRPSVCISGPFRPAPLTAVVRQQDDTDARPRY
jgi:hypothetical protein